ncbi:hypothetical protein [Thiosocius teredinicola]|uniref:hypothetical protein n=1 Tax=Thiosocius teredinicola TaxID=1973002 RepID=UPI0013DDB4FA
MKAMGMRIAVVTFAAMLLWACDQDGPAEQAGEKIDNAVENAGEAIENAGDKIESSTNN